MTVSAVLYSRRMDCAIKLIIDPVLHTMSASARMVSVRFLCLLRKNRLLVKLVHSRARKTTAKKAPNATACWVNTRLHVASSNAFADSMSRDIAARARGSRPGFARTTGDLRIGGRSSSIRKRCASVRGDSRGSARAAPSASTRLGWATAIRGSASAPTRALWRLRSQLRAPLPRETLAPSEGEK